MSEAVHTIELLEIRKRPKGSAYTVRHCDATGCQERATHVARLTLAEGRDEGCMFACPEHAAAYCEEYGLTLLPA